MSVYVPLMTRTEVSYNSGIPVSENNPASGVQANDNINMSPSLSGLEPQSVSHSGMIDLSLGPDSRGPVPETVVE